MLKTVAPYSLRGVIWYQGESDDRHPEVYATVFSQMIRCWRSGMSTAKTSCATRRSCCGGAVTVRYAQTPFFTAKLFNAAGIPARPFETNV